MTRKLLITCVAVLAAACGGDAPPLVASDVAVKPPMPGMKMTAGYLIQSMFRGRRAPMNPWGGRSLEWQCASPPPYNNFDAPPTVGDCYDYSVLEWDEQDEGYKWRDDAARPTVD